MYIVYMHEHRENGKKYIGITCQDPYKRWGNGKNYKKTSYFRNAVDKYGWDMFRHEILYTNLSQKEACRIEQELIAKYKTNDREYGYNNSIGGESGALGNRHKLSEETKRKMSIAKRCMSEETKEKMRARISLNRGIYCEGFKKYNESSRKKVMCIETNTIYNGVKEAARITGINVSGISCCCNKKQSHTRLKDGTKLHWIFVIDAGGEDL